MEHVINLLATYPPRYREVSLVEAQAMDPQGNVVLVNGGKFLAKFWPKLALEVEFSTRMPLNYCGLPIGPRETISTPDPRMVSISGVDPSIDASLWGCRYDRKRGVAVLTTPGEATDVILLIITDENKDCPWGATYADTHSDMLFWHDYVYYTEDSKQYRADVMVMPVDKSLRILLNQIEEQYQNNLAEASSCISDAEEYGDRYLHELMTAAYAARSLGWKVKLTQDNTLDTAYLGADGHTYMEDFYPNREDLGWLWDALLIYEETVWDRLIAQDLSQRAD